MCNEICPEAQHLSDLQITRGCRSQGDSQRVDSGLRAPTARASVLIPVKPLCRGRALLMGNRSGAHPCAERAGVSHQLGE